MVKSVFSRISLFVLVLVTACNERILTTNSLAGDWELRHRRGGFVQPGTPETYPVGNGTKYSFNQGEFKHYQENKLIETGTFRIEKESQELNDENLTEKMVFVVDGSESVMPIKLSGDSLQIHHGQIAADGVVLTYVRVK